MMDALARPLLLGPGAFASVSTASGEERWPSGNADWGVVVDANHPVSQ